MREKFLDSAPLYVLLAMCLAQFIILFGTIAVAYDPDLRPFLARWL